MGSEKKIEKNYRQDIDGLRAIAVLAVILFHISPSILPGGFVGVDVFFVISGYLISLHIFKEIDNGTFSLTTFYQRRVKRIIPVMMVVCATVTVFAQFVLLPTDAENVASSALWSIFSMGNVYFWLHQDGSYFATASDQLPLLHLWSLGVEEQFYIFWPLLLILIYKIINKSIFLVVVGLVSLGSFFLAEVQYQDAPMFVYYMLPTRMGELLVGAIVALIELNNRVKLSRPMAITLSFSGLLLFAVSLLIITKNSVFPGLWALVPTVGTALLIFAGTYQTLLVQRILAFRPLVFVGLVSYSAYLWHWPILAFYRYGNFEINMVSGSVLFFVIMFVAWLSYKFIETPFRRVNLGPRAVFSLYYFLPASLLSVACVVFLKLDGFGLRWWSPNYANDVKTIAELTKPSYEYDYVCQSFLVDDNAIKGDRCVVGKRSADQAGNHISTVLWGDSNAAHFVGAVGAFANYSGFQFRNIQASSCPPIKTSPDRFVEPDKLSKCAQSIKNIWPSLSGYKNIIISSAWTNYTSRSKDFLQVFFTDLEELTETADNIILIGKVPFFLNYDRYCWQKKLSFPYMNCNYDTAPIDRSIALVNQQLKAFAKTHPKIDYYDFNSYLCPDGLCSVFDLDGEPAYFDRTHLSLPASWKLGEQIIHEDGVPQVFQRLVN
ncbi:MAG: peptidoglycan/LPS O-acetylase OafA/YrhL [Paraglaciecola sp.]|jgi:peptidoglycan/LPS O-acetylase OafA/YrhL